MVFSISVIIASHLLSVFNFLSKARVKYHHHIIMSRFSRCSLNRSATSTGVRYHSKVDKDNISHHHMVSMGAGFNDGSSADRFWVFWLVTLL